MILHINSSEYDYHTLVKVAEMAGLAGFVGFHESEDGYIVSFPDTENTQALINDYKARLRDLENNIWQLLSIVTTSRVSRLISPLTISR